MSTEIALDALFDEYHANNPEVYLELVNLARRMKARGYRRIGIGQLFEVLRWERSLPGVGDDSFKCNNSFRSRFARKIMAEQPDLAGIFQTRELKTA